MNTSQMSAVVVGVGSIGRRHVQNLKHIGLNDISIVDPNPSARDAIQTNYDVEVYADFDNGMINQYDIAVIGSPTSFHVENAINAANNGCHLLIEKPLSHAQNGIEELEQLVDEKGLVSLVGCNLRFHPAIRRIKDIVESNVIGEVVATRIEGGSYLPNWFPDSDYRTAYSAKEELGGGVILDYIHEINYARWLFGEFETVSGMMGQETHLDIETHDIASLHAQTVDGTICQFHLDYVQQPYSRSCHVIGEEGTIRWSWDEGVEWYTTADENWNSFECPSDWEMNEMYLDELEHFLSCIENNKPTTCPVSCGRRDLEVALAARDSATTGQHVTLSNPKG